MLLNYGVGEDSWSPLDCKEIQPVHPKGDQSWVRIGGTDSESETPILWPPDAKNWLIGKDPDAGKDWGQEQKGTTDDMVGWRHQLKGHGFGWTLGVGDGQGSLVCCRSWGHKESDRTEQLNWTEQNYKNLPANAGDVRDASSIPRSRRSPGGGNSNPLNILAWRIPWTELEGYSPWRHKESDMT